MSMNEPMTDFVKLILTPQDKQSLELLASDDDRSMSSTVRQLIREEMRRRNLQLIQLNDNLEPATN